MKNLITITISLLIILINSCAQLKQIVDQATIKKPQVRINQVSIADLSFVDADLLFDIEISNPNNLSISLAGFDYDFLINQTSFLKGDQSKKIEINANERSVFQLPLTLVYDNIYKTYNQLKKADEIKYQLKTGLRFNLPVLGEVRVPVSTSGNLPTLKLPTISLHKIHLDRLTLTGADLSIGIQIDNPNSWSVLLNQLDYQLTINGQKWLKGNQQKQIAVKSKHQNQLTIPFSMNFLEIGRTVYSLLSDGKGLNYNLNGSATIGSSLEMLKPFNLPFNKSGEIDITK